MKIILYLINHAAELDIKLLLLLVSFKIISYPNKCSLLPYNF